MNLQEMLTTENPDSITDEQLKAASYDLTYGEFDLELQPRQRELQARLRKIEQAEKPAPTRQRMPDWDAYRDDSDDDEYEWS